MKNNHQTVLITGSSRGIGASIATLFAKNHYNVILNCYQSTAQMAALQQSLLNYNKNILSIQADVRNMDAVGAMFEQIHASFGPVDVLINNAAVSSTGLFTDTTPKDWQSIIDANIMPMLNCCHHAILPMVKKRKGTIINISSIWGNVGASCESLYSLTKGAVNTFTKSLAKELAPSCITVNAIACGVIDTKMNGWMDEDEKQMLIDQIPLMRFGFPQEIAGLAYYLASESAAYITGQIITADGGLTV